MWLYLFPWSGLDFTAHHANPFPANSFASLSLVAPKEWLLRIARHWGISSKQKWCMDQSSSFWSQLWGIVHACVWVVPKNSSVTLTQTLAKDHHSYKTLCGLLLLGISSVLASGSLVLGKYHITRWSLSLQFLDHQPPLGVQHGPCFWPSFFNWRTFLLFIITIWKLAHSLVSLLSISVSTNDLACDVGSLTDNLASDVVISSPT